MAASEGLSKSAWLRPRTSQARAELDLGGVWDFALESQVEPDWTSGFKPTAMIAVPGAWAEQVVSAAHHTGAAWHQREFSIPRFAKGGRIVLRFDAASLVADVWLDGALLGCHEGGFLPFGFDITDRVSIGRRHKLVVRVEHGLSTHRTPVGGRPASSGFQGSPPTSYDFFPFGGLIRPVRLLLLPAAHIESIETTATTLAPKGAVAVRLTVSPGFTGQAVLRLSGRPRAETRLDVREGMVEGTLDWTDPRPWSPADPHLETLEIELLEGGEVVDAYAQPFGLRTVAATSDALLLNGERVILKGFGKHEDFPVNGRGLNEAVIVRDNELLRWLGANSYRTSHYPYAEEALELADRAGLLVVSETSAVGLNFWDGSGGVDARLTYARAELAELIRRDRNHPSVIAWSVANEPFAKPVFAFGAEVAPEALKAGIETLSTLVADTRALDPSRPVMVVGAQSQPDEFLDLGDILAVNRYYGWYTQGGDLPAGAKIFGDELDALHAKYRKPILVTEFGADTLAGHHDVSPGMWSEEYQAEMLDRYLDEIDRRSFVIGAHVWNFADFKTGQGILRAAGMNHKGVFTRDRQPKLAAHHLRRRWSAPS